MAKNLNDIAWEKLLKDIPVVSEADAHGFFDSPYGMHRASCG